MKKDEIVSAKLGLVDWVDSLKTIPDELWFQAFREGSWGTDDVISHFISWDHFLIEKKFHVY